jgi:hypothetical protein
VPIGASRQRICQSAGWRNGPGRSGSLQAGGQGVQVPGGGLALLDQKTHKSVHLAFPKVSHQVEVFDSSAARALALATPGQVRPA